MLSGAKQKGYIKVIFTLCMLKRKLDFSKLLLLHSEFSNADQIPVKSYNNATNFKDVTLEKSQKCCNSEKIQKHSRKY